MNILLLGGTGAIGVHLSHILTQGGHEVYVTSRRERETNNPHLHYIRGNAQDFDFVEKVLEEKAWDAIVDFMVYTTVTFKTKMYNTFARNQTIHIPKLF